MLPPQYFYDWYDPQNNPYWGAYYQGYDPSCFGYPLPNCSRSQTPQPSSITSNTSSAPFYYPPYPPPPFMYMYPPPFMGFRPISTSRETTPCYSDADRTMKTPSNDERNRRAVSCTPTCCQHAKPFVVEESRNKFHTVEEPLINLSENGVNKMRVDETEEENDFNSLNYDKSLRKSMKSIPSVDNLHSLSEENGEVPLEELNVQPIIVEEDCSDDETTEVEDDISQDTETAEMHYPHQLSVIYEENDESINERRSSIVSRCSTLSDCSTTLMEEDNISVDYSADELDEENSNSVTVRLPLKFSFTRSKDNLVSTTLTVGESESDFTENNSKSQENLSELGHLCEKPCSQKIKNPTESLLDFMKSPTPPFQKQYKCQTKENSAADVSVTLRLKSKSKSKTPERIIAPVLSIHEHDMESPECSVSFSLPRKSRVGSLKIKENADEKSENSGENKKHIDTSLYTSLDALEEIKRGMAEITNSLCSKICTLRKSALNIPLNDYSYRSSSTSQIDSIDTDSDNDESLSFEGYPMDQTSAEVAAQEVNIAKMLNEKVEDSEIPESEGNNDIDFWSQLSTANKNYEDPEIPQLSKTSTRSSHYWFDDDYGEQMNEKNLNEENLNAKDNQKEDSSFKENEEIDFWKDYQEDSCEFKKTEHNNDTASKTKGNELFETYDEMKQNGFDASEYEYETDSVKTEDVSENLDVETKPKQLRETTPNKQTITNPSDYELASDEEWTEEEIEVTDYEDEEEPQSSSKPSSGGSLSKLPELKQEQEQETKKSDIEEESDNEEETSYEEDEDEESIHNVQKTRESVLETKESVEETENSIYETKESIQKDKETVQKTCESVEKIDNMVQMSNSSSHQRKDSIREIKIVTQHKNEPDQKTDNSIQKTKTSFQKTIETVMETTAIVKETKVVLQYIREPIEFSSKLTQPSVKGNATPEDEQESSEAETDEESEYEEGQGIAQEHYNDSSSKISKGKSLVNVNSYNSSREKIQRINEDMSDSDDSEYSSAEEPDNAQLNQTTLPPKHLLEHSNDNCLLTSNQTSHDEVLKSNLTKIQSKDFEPNIKSESGNSFEQNDLEFGDGNEEDSEEDAPAEEENKMAKLIDVESEPVVEVKVNVKGKISIFERAISEEPIERKEVPRVVTKYSFKQREMSEPPVQKVVSVFNIPALQRAASEKKEVPKNQKLLELINQKKSCSAKEDATKSVKERVSSFECSETDLNEKRESFKRYGNSKKSSPFVRSIDESGEEDSGVNSDFCKQLSENETDSENFPELRKLSRYQRASTHSRLFKLLQGDDEITEAEEEAKEIEKMVEKSPIPYKSKKIIHNVSVTRRQNPKAASEAETMEQRRQRLCLPLSHQSSSGAESMSSSTTPSPTPSVSVINEKLVNELVQSLLSQKRGRAFQNLPIEKLHAAAIKILQEDMESNGTLSSADESTIPTVDSTPALTPQEFRNNSSYSEYYESWDNTSQQQDSDPSDLFLIQSKAFKNLQEQQTTACKKLWAVRCPRILSSKSINKDLARLSEVRESESPEPNHSRSPSIRSQSTEPMSGVINMKERQMAKNYNSCDAPFIRIIHKTVPKSDR